MRPLRSGAAQRGRLTAGRSWGSSHRSPRPRTDSWAPGCSAPPPRSRGRWSARAARSQWKPSQLPGQGPNGSGGDSSSSSNRAPFRDRAHQTTPSRRPGGAAGSRGEAPSEWRQTRSSLPWYDRARTRLQRESSHGAPSAHGFSSRSRSHWVLFWFCTSSRSGFSAFPVKEKASTKLEPLRKNPRCTPQHPQSSSARCTHRGRESREALDAGGNDSSYAPAAYNGSRALKGVHHERTSTRVRRAYGSRGRTGTGRREKGESGQERGTGK